MRKHLFVFGALALAFAGPASAGERVDLFTPDGKRAGYAILDLQRGRVDFFDAQSRRTGWGRLSPSGQVERFDLRGNRQTHAVLPPRSDDRNLKDP